MKAPMSEDVRIVLESEKGSELVDVVLDSEQDPNSRYIYFQINDHETLVLEKPTRILSRDRHTRKTQGKKKQIGSYLFSILGF